MTLRRFFIVTFVLLVSFVYWTSISEAQPGEPKVKWKMASNSPEGITLAKFINRDICDGLERATDGEVAFVWYHGGIMGDNRDWLAKMQIDQLQGCILDGSGVESTVPNMGVMQLPFLFNDFDEVAYIKEKMRGKLSSLFERRGYKVLMMPDQSFDVVFSTRREIRTPEDFTRSRFVAYCGEVEHAMFKALGASPIPLMVPEIAASMRAGIVDGLICPAGWYVGSQLYTITKSVTCSKMRYVMGSIVVTQKAWNEIPEKYHKPIEKTIFGLEPGFNDALSRNESLYVDAMVKYGLKRVELTPSENEAWKKKTRPVWDRLSGKLFPREVLDEVLGYLEEYRSKRVTSFHP